MVSAHGWWGLAYREAIFRLADHAQSRLEQEQEAIQAEVVAAKPFKARKQAAETFQLPLPGLDGANPLAYLAAIGTLLTCEQIAATEQPPAWLKGGVKLSWGADGSPQTPMLHFQSGLPTQEDFIAAIVSFFPRAVAAHSMCNAVRILEKLVEDKNITLATHVKEACRQPQRVERPPLDWIASLVCETIPEAASQLQTTRRDYVLGNLHSILERTTAQHLHRTLFETWDYADALSNQSLHWEPTEDRRHAYQWHMPSGDPTRNRGGGMLGANRLALEAWPLFPSFPMGDKAATRGFQGLRMYDTFWTWPLWKTPQSSAVVASLMSLKRLHDLEPSARKMTSRGVWAAFRSQRILVGKTPNLTAAMRIC